jgi:hypothetical protein
MRAITTAECIDLDRSGSADCERGLKSVLVAETALYSREVTIREANGPL